MKKPRSLLAWRLLQIVPNNPPGLAPVELAALLGEPRATVSMACRRLAAKGLLRRQGPSGRRQVFRYWVKSPG